MDKPAGQRMPGTTGTRGTTGTTGTIGPGRRAGMLGSVTIPGCPEQVSGTRAFVARTLDRLAGVDRDAATLLTSELVTNAIQHTDSGAPGGTVTIVVLQVRGGVLVEVVDNGSAGTPVVKADLYAAEGHGLFMVQQLAAQWGYLREESGTTVWFHLATADEPVPGPVPDPDRESRNGHPVAVTPATAAAAWTASSTPAQIRATSSSPVT
jgi:anti-sigma regulatory factor (Ser/Thr protein kinase)